MRLPKLTSLTEGLRATTLRFPIPTLFAAITTVLLVFSVDNNFNNSPILRYAFLAGLGFVASLLCDLISEARNAPILRRLLGQIGIVLLLWLYCSFAMPELLDEANPSFWYSYFILLFALHLGIALVPSLTPDGTNLIWRFNLNCFLRYFFSSVNAALLFGGLALALVSVDKLFELGIDDALYPKLWVLCAFFAHPLLFLGGLPRFSQLSQKSDFPKPLRFSLCFIGLPLVALYLTILYAYVAKIGIQWSWPNGWVAMPIFVLAVISLLTFTLSLPLPKSENWARFYHRWLFRLLLPLAIVLFLALQIRLGDYGMTINRYLGLALALWLFGISLTYIIHPTLKIGWMPFSLLIVSLFSIYAGPFGAFGWSERAQIQRLHSMATNLGAMENGAFAPTLDSQDPETVVAFQSALRYVLRNFGAKPLKDELAGFYQQNENKEFSSQRSNYMTQQIMKYLELDDDLQNVSTYFYANKVAMQTYGHIWMLDYNFYGYHKNGTKQKYDLDDIKLSFNAKTKDNSLSITANQAVIMNINTAPWVEDVKEAVKKHGNNNQKPLIWDAEENGWSFTFVCTNAQLNNAGKNFRSAQLKVFLTPPN